MSLNVAYACDNQTYGNGSASFGSRAEADFGREGDPSLASSGHNVGIYYYNPSTGTSQLVQSYYDPSASSWAFNPGYVVQSDSSFAGSGINSSDEGISCSGGEDPAQLPPMTVSANVPMRIWISGGYFARILNAFGGGGGSGVNAIRVTAIVQAPSDYTCNQMEELRLATANALAVPHVRQARRGYDFVMVMPNGQREHWSFMCGGSYCGPTVLQPSPRISPCGN